MGITLPDDTAFITKRVIHTTADFSYVEQLVYQNDPVSHAVQALKSGACIVTDTNMAKAGVSKTFLSSLGGQVVCYMADEDGKTIGLHSRCHTYFTPNEGELEDHLKMLLDFFFDTHNAIKDNMNQLGNAAIGEEEKKERVKVKGFAAYKENTTPIKLETEQPA